jgi:HAD superfamily hydrolase (TIGR01484 family)
MKDISMIDNDILKDIEIIVLDVDGVLVPRGSIIEQEGRRTMFETKKIRESEINYIKQMNKLGYKINICSGRSLFMLQDMFREVLPFVTITYENGSATWSNGNIVQHTNTFKHIEEVRKELINIKDDRIKGWEPKEFIITIHSTSRIKKIEETVDLFPDMQCIWNGEAYDIMHKSQTKANGIKHLMDMFKLNKNNMLAIGDSYNDEDMLSVVGLAISADCDRVGGDYYIPMPAGVMMWKIIHETRGKKEVSNKDS